MTERSLCVYDYVDSPYDDVTRLLAEDAADILQSATEAASQHADEVVARLTVEVGGFEVGRDVQIQVGAFEPVGITHVRVPLRWHARDRAALFPAMDAALEVRVVPVEQARTQIILIGSYEPPLGRMGAAMDAAVGHHVVESTVHRFVRDIAERVEELAAIEEGTRPRLAHE
jgi:hypothetical protein